jgi:hypothetical protein
VKVDFWIKEGNTAPVFSATLRAAGQPIASVPDGTTATFTLRSTRAGTDAAYIVAPAELVSTIDGAGNPVVKALYTFTSEQTTGAAGVYYADVTLDFPGGASETFPNDDVPIVVAITPALG